MGHQNQLDNQNHRFRQRNHKMLLLLWMVGSVSGCWNSTRLMNLMLGIGGEPEYSIADESAEAVEYWAGKTDGKSGDCLEPLFFTYSCDPLDWSSNDRNA